LGIETRYTDIPNMVIKALSSDNEESDEEEHQRDPIQGFPCKENAPCPTELYLCREGI